MDKREDAMVLWFLVLGVFLLLAGTFLQAIVFSQAGNLVPQLAARDACQKEGGAYVLGLPTGAQVCGAIGDMKHFSDIDCNFAPPEKRSSCRKLQQILFDRSFDCLSVLLNSTSKYSIGAPEVAVECDELVA